MSKRNFPNRATFVREYLIDRNATKAAIRAGYSSRSAYSQGHRLLNQADIKQEIESALAEQAARTGITADAVVQRWWDIAHADPNDLVEYRRTACRRCYGVGHAWQWIDEEEFAAAVEKRLDAIEKRPGLRPVDDAGGYGFDASRPPVQECPGCGGAGHGYVHVHDTRNLSGRARLIYAGVKESREGIEVKMIDQSAALERVARHLGMFIDRSEVSGPNGGPVRTADAGPLAGLDLSKLTADELDALERNDDIIAAARQRQAADPKGEGEA